MIRDALAAGHSLYFELHGHVRRIEPLPGGGWVYIFTDWYGASLATPLPNVDAAVYSANMVADEHEWQIVPAKDIQDARRLLEEALDAVDEYEDSRAKWPVIQAEIEQGETEPDDLARRIRKFLEKTKGVKND